MVNIALGALWKVLKNPKVLVLLAVLALAGGAFWGVKSYVADVSYELSAARESIARLSNENAAYIRSVKSKDETIKQIKERLSNIIAINQIVEQQNQLAQRKMATLQSKLDALELSGKTPAEKDAKIQSIFLNELGCLAVATGGDGECDSL